MRDRNGWTLGRRVKIVEGSGIDSGEVVTVVSHTLIRVDGRGIPQNTEGDYRPVNWRNDVAVRFSNGRLAVWPKSRLVTVRRTSLR